jgi:nucleoside-diphosphate-sugar epimerase
MNFILTGHKGLIGHFLLEKLKARGDKPVLLIDKRDGQNINNLERFPLKERADVFIHLAALCKINKSIEDPQPTFENNVLGIHKVMEFCRKHRIPKIVFTSSSRILSKEKNPYTASKIYAEELIKAYSQCYGIDYAIIRPSTVYGPFNDQTQRLVDIFILNALQGKELKIFGDEKKTLDFTYIDDFVDGFLRAMDQKNKAFNISAGEGVKVSYIADLIINLAGKGYKTFHKPEIAQPQEVELDIAPIKSLGYTPRVSIEDGVRRTFSWYKNNYQEILKTRDRNEFKQ